MLPTLTEFLARSAWPNNSYLQHADFTSLYVRKGTIGIRLNNELFWCHPCLTIASIEAKNPGQGAFAALVKEIEPLEMAIYVEIVHNLRFRVRLEKMGFIRVDGDGPSFIINHENRMESAKDRPVAQCSD